MMSRIEQPFFLFLYN